MNWLRKVRKERGTETIKMMTTKTARIDKCSTGRTLCHRKTPYTLPVYTLPLK